MSRSTRGPRGILFLVAGMALSCLVSTRVNAVPAFSRKYQTSCQTCHSIFPKLNPFGTAFRLNGYHLPGETEEQVKQKPVSLGADAYARMWPEMVYPSTLPGNAPFALNVKMANLYASSHDDTGKTIIHNDFQFPQEANLFAAGTLGKSLQLLQRGDVRGEPGRERLGRDRARPPRRHLRVRTRAPLQLPHREAGPEPLRRIPGNVADDRQRGRHALHVQPDRVQRRNGSRGGGRRRQPAGADAGHRDVRRGGPPPLLHGRALVSDRAGRPERPVQQRQRQGLLRARRLQVRRPRAGRGLDRREAPAGELARDVVPRRRVRLLGRRRRRRLRRSPTPTATRSRCSRASSAASACTARSTSAT